MSKFKTKKAFSLVEISIVVLIIGLLIAGISKASDMVQDSQLKAGRSLTRASKAGRIPGLLLWLETSTTESLKDNERFSGTAISTWSDISPPNVPKLIFRQSGNSSTNAIKYNEGTSSTSLPYIDFASSSDYMYAYEPSKTAASSSNLYSVMSTQAFPSSDITIFVVARPAESFSVFTLCPTTSGSGIVTTQNCSASGAHLTLAFGAASSNLIKLEYGGATGTAGVLASKTGYKTTEGPFIYSVVSQIGKAKIFTNGGDSSASVTAAAGPPIVVGTNPTAFTSYSGSYKVGGGGPGNLYELIVYSSLLSDSDRQKVEDYLAAKYKIKLAATRQTF